MDRSFMTCKTPSGRRCGTRPQAVGRTDRLSGCSSVTGDASTTSLSKRESVSDFDGERLNCALRDERSRGRGSGSCGTPGCPHQRCFQTAGSRERKALTPISLSSVSKRFAKASAST
jgi:hypothetical protein